MCNDGFGLSSDFTSCLPCPANCLTCYMAQNNSCLKTKGAITPSGCQYYVDRVTNKCIQSCSSSNVQPQFFNGTLYCVPVDASAAQSYARIDSAIYVAADGTRNVFFVMDQTIKDAS